MSEWYRLCQLQGFCGAGLGQRQIGAVLRRTIARASGMDDRQLRVLQLIRQLRFLFHFITPAIVCLPGQKCMYAALLCPQPLHQLRIRRHVAGAVGRIDDHARLCAAGLFDKAHRRIIHRDALPLPGLGLIGCQHHRLLHTSVRRCLPVAGNDDMAAVNFLRMEPEV